VTASLEAASARPAPVERSRLTEVPVAYGGENGPDLPAVARYASTSEQEVVRPFSDTGVRTVLCEKTARGLWRVSQASLMDRRPEGVAAPVAIEYVEFRLADGRVWHIDDPTQLLARSDWPHLLAGREVQVTVKVATPGAIVFLHDRYGFARHVLLQLTADAEDATLFHGTFSVPASGDDNITSAYILFGIRFLTVDAFEAATLSLDPSAVYNVHQWVVPFSYRPLIVVLR